MSYKIYHIPGVKIGCSINPSSRVKRQGYTNYEILEEHLSKSFASKRELELQEKYGYTKDRVSYDTFVNFKRQREGGSIGGKISGKLVTSRPEWKQIASKGGKIAGKIRASNITFEELSYAGKKNRVLKDYQVKWIRHQYDTKKYSMKRIRKLFGICHSTCSNIINYKTYKEI